VLISDSDTAAVNEDYILSQGIKDNSEVREKGKRKKSA